ncbi:MAG: DNA polymerase sliding clamp [Desulfurococcales archaeon]|nr:DNA polymerase sliding clamp [Desulfurococcales archaeon]
MTFHLVYDAATKFKYVTQTLAKISDEATFYVSGDQLIIWQMSPDKTTLAVLKAPSMSFGEFNVEEEAKFIVRTDELNKVIRRATRNDSIIFERDPSELALSVTLRDRKTGLVRSFAVSILDIEPPEIREPSFDATTRFSLDASIFKIIVQDVKVVGDSATFESKEEGVVTVKASGEEKEYVWEMRPNAPLLDVDVVEPSVSSYGRTPLEAATKPTGAADIVRVEYATDYPMRLEFTFPNGERMYIYIAPLTE